MSWCIYLAYVSLVRGNMSRTQNWHFYSVTLGQLWLVLLPDNSAWPSHPYISGCSHH